MDLQTRRADHMKSLRTVAGWTAVLLVLGMLPYTVNPTYDIKRLTVHAAGLVLVALWGWRTFSGRVADRWTPLRCLWVAFLALNAVAAAASSHVGHSLESLSWLAGLFLLYFAASQAFRKSEDVDRLFVYVILAVLASTAYGFVQRAGLDPFPWNLDADSGAIYHRLPATFGNPNLAGHVLVIAIGVSAYLCFARRSRWAWVPLSLFCLHLLMTAHRGGALAVVVGAAVVILAVIIARFTGKRGGAPPSPWKALSIFLAVTVIVGAASVWGALALSSRTFGMSSVLRLNSFYGASRMITDRPLLGYGPGNYEIDSVPYWTPLEQGEYAQRRRYNAHVHNEFLQSAVDAGLGGGVLYAGLLLTAACSALFVAFRAGGRSHAGQPLMFAALFTAFLVDGFFGFNLRAPASAGLLALLLGGYEGVYLQPKTAQADTVSWKVKAWTTTIVLLALANAVFGVRLFVAQWLLQRGQGAVAWGAHDDAQRLFARGARLLPWDWRFEYNAGLSAQTRQDYEGAVDGFRKALLANPNFIPAIVGVAQASLEIGVSRPDDDAFDTSRRYSEDALKLCPVLSEGHENLGRLALQRARGLKANHPSNEQRLRDELDAAEQHLTQALACSASNPADIDLLLVQVWLLRGDTARAESFVVRAAKAEPDNRAVWQAFSSLAEQSKNYDSLLSALANAIENVSSRPNPGRGALDLYVLVAKTQMRLGRMTEAANALQQAINLDPYRSATWDALAEFADKQGSDEALQDVVRQVAALPAEPGQKRAPLIDAATAYFEYTPQGLERGSALLFALVREWPDSMSRELVEAELGWIIKRMWSRAQQEKMTGATAGRVFLHLGYLLFRTGAREAAVRGLTRASATVTGEDAVSCAQYLGQVLAEMGRYVDAEEVLRKAIAEAPNQLELRTALIQVLTLAREPERAQQEQNEYARIRDSLAIAPKQ